MVFPVLHVVEQPFGEGHWLDEDPSVIRLEAEVDGDSRAWHNIGIGAEGAEQENRAVEVVCQECRGGHHRHQQVHLLSRPEERVYL